MASGQSLSVLLTIVVILYTLYGFAYLMFVLPTLPVTEGHTDSIILLSFASASLLAAVICIMLPTANGATGDGRPSLGATKAFALIFVGLSGAAHFTLLVINSAVYMLNEGDWRFLLFYYMTLTGVILSAGVLVIVTMYRPRPPPPPQPVPCDAAPVAPQPAQSIIVLNQQGQQPQQPQPTQAELEATIRKRL
jgi:hypothetical protein